jgi:intracellular septation protein A
VNAQALFFSEIIKTEIMKKAYIALGCLVVIGGLSYFQEEDWFVYAIAPPLLYILYVFIWGLVNINRGRKN